jgi:hypothetical protein
MLRSPGTAELPKPQRPRILEVFANVQRHQLLQHEHVVQTFQLVGRKNPPLRIPTTLTKLNAITETTRPEDEANGASPQPDEIYREGRLA